MHYKIILILLSFLLFSCETDIYNNKKILFKDNKENIFINKGFALIYREDLFKKKLVKKKLNNNELIIFQKNLKKNSRVLITNIKNKKSIIAKVGLNSDYPYFYNSVISSRISNVINLNEDNPYIQIKEISTGSSYVASITKTFEEEKNVASKAPVEKIKIKDLSVKKKDDTKIIYDKFNYSILIGDFYFKDSSYLMASKIKENTNIQKIKVKKINNTQYRVTIGPFLDLTSLKNSFNELKILNFENIEIIKN